MNSSSKPRSGFLPYGRQWIDEDDIDAVAKVLRGDFLTTGPKVTEFENSIKETLGVKHVIACSSGTAALHCALLAIGVGKGDKVIVPSLTFVATANAVRMCGAEVVFSDVDVNSGLMEALHFEEALNRAFGEAKAIIPVHLTGQCANMNEIKALADKHNVKIISDACHALGGEYQNQLGDGALGDCQYEDLSCFSFHPVKTIAMGEGGAIATNNDEYAKTIRSQISHGIWQQGEEIINEDMAFDSEGNINPWYHEFHRLGWNYRASDIHCALGISQMTKLTSFVEKRRQLAERYKENLTEIEGFARPIEENVNCLSARHLFPLLIDFDKLKIDKAKLMRQLKDHGIGTQVHYIPVHLQPLYRSENNGLDFFGAETYYKKTLSFPLYPHMELEDVDYVVTILKSIFN